MKNLLGKNFGRLTVIERAGSRVYPSGSKRVLWRCTCSCGKTKDVSSAELMAGDTRSCGCLRTKYPIVDGGKVCSACRKWFPVSQFNTCLGRLRTECKACSNKRSRKYQESEKYKKKKKVYDKKRYAGPAVREKVLSQAKVRGKINTRIEVDSITDRYVRHLLSANSALSRKDIPVELIEIKRKHLQLSRLLKDTMKKGER